LIGPAPGFGNGDAWVAKLKPDGSNFAWFSYLGGRGEDFERADGGIVFEVIHLLGHRQEGLLDNVLRLRVGEARLDGDAVDQLPTLRVAWSVHLVHSSD